MSDPLVTRGYCIKIPNNSLIRDKAYAAFLLIAEPLLPTGKVTLLPACVTPPWPSSPATQSTLGLQPHFDNRHYTPYPFDRLLWVFQVQAATAPREVPNGAGQFRRSKGAL